MNENVQLACNKVKHLEVKFKEVFGKSVYEFVGLLAAFGVWDFDIVKFDRWLTNCEGYRIETDGSMASFVEKKFGRRGHSLVKELLTIT